MTPKETRLAEIEKKWSTWGLDDEHAWTLKQLRAAWAELESLKGVHCYHQDQSDARGEGLSRALKKIEIAREAFNNVLLLRGVLVGDVFTKTSPIGEMVVKALKELTDGDEK